jgi:hypothetical protein
MIVGAVAAALTYGVVQRLLSERSSSNSEPANLKSISGVIGLGVGIAASVFAANRFSYTTIVAEKALKFFILNFVIGQQELLSLEKQESSLALFAWRPARIFRKTSSLWCGCFGCIDTVSTQGR